MHHQLLCMWIKLTEGTANGFCCFQSNFFIIQTHKCIIFNNNVGENSLLYSNWAFSLRYQIWCHKVYKCFSHLVDRNISFFCCSKFLLPLLFFFFVFQCDSDSDQEEKVRKEISMGAKIICWIHLLLLFCYLFRVSFWIDLKPLYTEKRLSFL